MSFKDFWASQSKDARMKIGLTVGVLFVVLFYGIFWRPLHHEVAALERKVTAQKNLLKWMIQSDTVLSQPENFTKKNSLKMNQSLQDLVVATLKSTSMEPNSWTVKNQNTNRIRVIFKPVPLRALLHWINTITRYEGVQITHVAIKKSKNAGWVTSEITLQYYN